MELKRIVLLFKHREDCCTKPFYLYPLGCNAAGQGWTAGVTRERAREIIREDLYSWANWVVERRLLNMHRAAHPGLHLTAAYDFVVMEPCPLKQDCRWPYTDTTGAELFGAE